MMKLRLSVEELTMLVARQLANLLVYNQERDGPILEEQVPVALEATEWCLSHSRNKYYRFDGELIFTPFHTGENTIFLYHLSRGIGVNNGLRDLADRVYYLNKILNGVDMYHEVRLPSIFDLDHPLGTVLGRATYADYFLFSQNCTVGNNRGVYPTFSEFVTLCAGATVIGCSHIGRNSIISASTFVKDEDIPDNAIVFGSSPHLVIKTRKETEMRDFFSQWIYNSPYEP
jgi:serine O-acetyltransferase